MEESLAKGFEGVGCVSYRDWWSRKEKLFSVGILFKELVTIGLAGQEEQRERGGG